MENAKCNSLYAIAFFLVTVFAAKPANACVVMADLKPEDIKYASVVVVGRIVDYKIVRPQDEVSKHWRKANGQKDILSDYARFNVVVEEVLAGQSPKTISVTWDNSTFDEPRRMGKQAYLIALRQPGSELPPLRGPSATILPSQEPDLFTVLQASCAPAFIFDASSATAKKIQHMLKQSETNRSGIKTKIEEK